VTEATEGDPLETLWRLMPPTADSDTQADWTQLGESWGMAFPSDYRWLIETYGAGEVQNYLSILSPEPRKTKPSRDGMIAETVNAEAAWTREPKAPELVGAHPELSDLSLWGRRTAKYLNKREYMRLLRQGLDPWTGEPDPYAGMFGDWNNGEGRGNTRTQDHARSGQDRRAIGVSLAVPVRCW